MAKKWVISLEIWNTAVMPKTTRIEQPNIENIIRSMASEQCANILIDDTANDFEDEIIEGFPTFIVCANEGNYSVSALIDENNGYDLIGEPTATGWVNFTIGGQEAPFPKKYIVSAEQAIAAANKYLTNGESVIAKYNWDKQNEPDSAWNA